MRALARKQKKPLADASVTGVPGHLKLTHLGHQKLTHPAGIAEGLGRVAKTA
jgi:hypothetical protein